MAEEAWSWIRIGRICLSHSCCDFTTCHVSGRSPGPPARRFGRVMTAGIGPDSGDWERCLGWGRILGIHAWHGKRVPRRRRVAARTQAPGRDQGAWHWMPPRAASVSAESGIRPGELGSASSAGRGTGMRPGFPPPNGSTASAKRTCPAALRPLPPDSARLLPRPEHDPKAHVRTSRAAVNAPTLDRDRSKAPPLREGGLRCRGGHFTHGDEPKRVSSARHP